MELGLLYKNLTIVSVKKKLAEEKAAAKKNFEEELHRASEGVPDLLTLPDRGWDPDHVLAQVGLCSNCSQPPRQRLGSGLCPLIGGIKIRSPSNSPRKWAGSLLEPPQPSQGSGSRPSIGGILSPNLFTFPDRGWDSKDAIPLMGFRPSDLFNFPDRGQDFDFLSSLFSQTESGVQVRF